MRCQTFYSLAAASLACSLLAITPAQATLYGGVDFPQGLISFADEVVNYSPTQTDVILPQYMIQDNALGAPNTAAVTLGSNGTIVLKFTDNFLTGSDDNTDDLWIFEVGPDVKSTFVWLSKDGTNWLSIGGIGGSTRGIDIDAFGYGTADQFAYVMLQDDPNQGDTGPDSPGADIDAVGAISTVRQFRRPARQNQRHSRSSARAWRDLASCARSARPDLHYTGHAANQAAWPRFPTMDRHLPMTT